MRQRKGRNTKRATPNRGKSGNDLNFSPDIHEKIADNQSQEIMLLLQALGMSPRMSLALTPLIVHYPPIKTWSSID